MTAYWFPDTTVFCNFASVRRLNLLANILDGRGRWTEAVAFEVRRSAERVPTLVDAVGAAWMGEPVEIEDPAEVLAIERVRRAALGGTDTELA